MLNITGEPYRSRANLKCKDGAVMTPDSGPPYTECVRGQYREIDFQCAVVCRDPPIQDRMRIANISGEVMILESPAPYGTSTVGTNTSTIIGVGTSTIGTTTVTTMGVGTSTIGTTTVTTNRGGYKYYRD